mgnify:FL=1
MANEFSYEVVEEIGTIGNPTPSGWSTQLNLVSWNGNEPKLDIRSWNEDHSRMGKGISLSMEEATQLATFLNYYLQFGTDDELNAPLPVSMEEAQDWLNGNGEEEVPLTHEEMLAEMASMTPEEMTE